MTLAEADHWKRSMNIHQTDLSRKERIAVVTRANVADTSDQRTEVLAAPLTQLSTVNYSVRWTVDRGHTTVSFGQGGSIPWP